MSASDQSVSLALSRRQVLAWGSGTALALVFSQSAFADMALSADDFVALSERLLDRDAGGLNTDDAAAYFDNLIAGGKADQLKALIDGTAEPALEQRILTQWYSGLQQIADGDAVVTYTDALVWDALDYTKPMGWCGGETGYWADAPEGEA